MTRQETNARLAAIREQLAALIPQVGELSNAAPYKFGSRVSFVADRLQQAVEEIQVPELFCIFQREKKLFLNKLNSNLLRWLFSQNPVLN